MKTVILAGGKGTRMNEHTTIVPKPLLEVGGIPIIEHIMRLYSLHNYNDFIICTGHKADKIKSHFIELQNLEDDIFVDFTMDTRTSIKKKRDPIISSWKVNIINTGEDTMTGGRIKQIEKYIEQDEFFFATYGDAVSDVDLKALLNFHKKHGKIATLTAVHPPQRFGNIFLSATGKVDKFIEKKSASTLINGGFFVFSRKIFDYIQTDENVLERDVLSQLALEGELYAYYHEGFWQCMDLIHEREYLEWIWNRNKSWQVGKNGIYDQSFHEKKELVPQ